MDALGIDERTDILRMEHRWGLRMPCCADARICSGAEVIGYGRLRNVSMSGAYIETPFALPMFAPVGITVLRDDDRRGTELLASVVRRDATGVGVEWTEPVAGTICPVLGCTKPCASGFPRC